MDEIIRCIQFTQFPHKHDIELLPLHSKILRDVDIASTLHSTWIQQTIFGFSDEMGISNDDALKMQIPFLSSIKFETEWAEKEYRPQIVKRIEEVNKMIECLELT
jgi:hypothetical protein